MKTALDDEVGITSKWLILTFILIGLVLILVSFILPHDNEGVWNYLRDIFRELGVVVSSVFTVSLVHERLIARKYVQQFLSLLRDLIEQGESNSAICARLGIDRIFYARDDFEREYPISNWTSRLDAASSLRVVAQTLYHLMSKTDTIKEAIKQGAKFEFCIFDPASPSSEIEKHQDLLITDINSAVSLFRKQIGEWVEAVKPAGQVELRYHRVPIFDSLLSLSSNHESLMVWDWGFGRDIMVKRILLIDPAKPIGKDLKRRYDHVWNNARPVFKYDGRQVCVNELSTPNWGASLEGYSLTSPRT